LRVWSGSKEIRRYTRGRSIGLSGYFVVLRTRSLAWLSEFNDQPPSLCTFKDYISTSPSSKTYWNRKLCWLAGLGGVDRKLFSVHQVISTTSAPKLSQSSPTYAPSRKIDVVTPESQRHIVQGNRRYPTRLRFADS
jgi:hypothetical protein